MAKLRRKPSPKGKVRSNLGKIWNLMRGNMNAASLALSSYTPTHTKNMTQSVLLYSKHDMWHSGRLQGSYMNADIGTVTFCPAVI